MAEATTSGAAVATSTGLNAPIALSGTTEGERLRALLAASGLTHARLADYLGATRESVSQWCADARKASRHYSELCDLFGITLDWYVRNHGTAPDAVAVRAVALARVTARESAQLAMDATQPATSADVR